MIGGQVLRARRRHGGGLALHDSAGKNEAYDETQQYANDSE